MSKHHKRSQKPSHPEHQHQQRWGKQQQAMRENQFARDMQYFADNGQFDTEAQQQETLARVLWNSQDWRHEAEFSDLVFDPYDNERALQQAWNEMEFDPEAYEQLSEEEQDDEDFELHALAIERVLTPEIQKDFSRRLDRFRARLRHQRQWETLAEASLVQLTLESEDTEDVLTWPECMLIFTLHTEAVDRYLELQTAAETAMNQALQTLGKSPEDELSEAEREQFEELVQTAAGDTPGLLEFLDRTTDEAYDEALRAVRDAVFFFGLFSQEEAEEMLHRFTTTLLQANPQGAAPEDLSRDALAKVDRAIANMVAIYLTEIDTPQRRLDLYQLARTRLAEAEAEAEEPLNAQAELLQQFLEDETLPLADNEFFQAVLMGEANYYLQLAAQTKEDDAPDLADDDQPDEDSA